MDLTHTADEGSPAKSALAALDVEAWVELDGVLWAVGGTLDPCVGFTRAQATTEAAREGTCAYLNRSSPAATSPAPNTTSWQYITHRTGPIVAPIPYTPKRHAANVPWPPLGLHLEVDFGPPLGCPSVLTNITITVHYEMLQGAPSLSKWVTVTSAANSAGAGVVIGNVIVETLRVNDDFAGASYPVADGWVTGAASGSGQPPLLLAKTDITHGSGCIWGTRPESTYSNNRYVSCAYTGSDSTSPPAQCHPDAHPAEVCPGSGVQCPSCGKPVCPCPTVTLAPGAHVNLTDASVVFFNRTTTRFPASTVGFESFHTRLIFFDTTEQERRGLSVRRVSLLTTPWISENPLFFHLTDTSPAGIQNAADDAAAVGIEMLVQSFGTSFKMEDDSPLYMSILAHSIHYANAKGIEVGGYDLIDLDRSGLGPAWDVVGTDGKVGSSACFASGWTDHLYSLVNGKLSLNLTMIETDGPYGGQVCSSKEHAHHSGLADSVYWQMRIQGDFFAVMRERGIFVNAPDIYFEQGANKMMFYGDPTNYGQPRQKDLLLSRQMLFDATYEWLPTQGWSFVPLENYAGGVGPGSQFAPLEANVADYDLAWAMNMGYGVAGVCWRGSHIFDGPLSKAVVVKWISWYNRYRSTLTVGNLIHVRRPDGQGVDAVLHAQPKRPDGVAGLLFCFNPTSTTQSVSLKIPLYYTGLNQTVTIQSMDGSTTHASLQRDYSIILTNITIRPKGYAWWTLL